jgi:hypothetical protein
MQDASDGGSDEDNEDANLMDIGDDLEAVQKEGHSSMEKKKKSKLDRLFARKNNDVLST